MEVGSREIATFEEKCKAIQDAFTPQFYTQLVKYSIYRINNKTKVKYDLDKGIRGIMVQDLINDTIESLLKEDGRNWYKDKFPDIRKQIMSCLDSVISNTITSELERINNTFIIFDNENIEIVENDEYDKTLSACHDILKELDCTDEEILLFEPYIIHEMKRKDIAEFFGIPLNELTNIKKRLDRKIPILKEKLKVLGYEK
ncbi:hypothetical protein CMU21_14005 [Elizabethkingia anophelis]|jgi:hypothetical protein|nr:hypothetical protein [Elizabethkingia anophelis]